MQLNRRGPAGSAEGLRLHPHGFYRFAFIVRYLLWYMRCRLVAVFSLLLSLFSLFLLLYFRMLPKSQQVSPSGSFDGCCSGLSDPCLASHSMGEGNRKRKRRREGGRGHKPLKLVRLFLLGPCFGFCWL